MRRAVPLLLALCLAFWTVPAHAERRVALVIGNGAYPTAPLKNPVNDASDMARTLRELGFEVIQRENASLRQMEDALDEFWQSLRKGGTGLFFFAGHGLQVKGVNYLVPVDARISVEQDVKSLCLDANRVLGRMEDAGNGLNIVLLDACRNNPFARAWRSAEAGLAKMDAPTGTLIGYATAPDSVAADGSGRNGVYTQHLLRELRVPGQNIETALKRVRVGVLNDTGRRQTPWESSSLTGDFYFNGQGGQGAPAAAATPPMAVVSLPVPSPKADAKAEKKRLADEAAQLKREQEELAELNAIQAEKARLEAERRKLEQAKLLALTPQPNQAQPALAQLVGRYAVAQGQGKTPGPLVFEFGLRDGQLIGTPSGGGSATRPVSITNIRLQGKTLSFRYNYQLVVFGIASDGHTDFTGDLGGEMSALPFTAVLHDGTSREVWLKRLPDVH
jgi:hypothetical protein